MERCIAILILFVSLLCVIESQAADVSGSEDHPLITRFPASNITWYDQQSFASYRIATGPVTGYRKIDEWLNIEGKLTRINYVLKGNRGLYEVYANYLNAVKKAGFTILAEGFDKASSVQGKIGQRGFLGVHYAANALPPGASQLLAGSSTSGGSGYFAARWDRPEGAVYIVLGATQYKQDEIVTLLDIIEQRPMEDNLVTVDAEAMSKDIDLYGKVALYGIYFDHDKATIKPESRPALEEIAKLLTKRTNLKVYVVGHTDASGDLAYNLRLSKSRAQAVVDALSQEHGIAAKRLEAHGVGPLTPVAPNHTDSGRAKNRRVELVER
ncbi:MAG: OmpA family protein [Candidatus Binatia bacterium]